MLFIEEKNQVQTDKRTEKYYFKDKRGGRLR